MRGTQRRGRTAHPANGATSAQRTSGWRYWLPSAAAGAVLLVIVSFAWFGVARLAGVRFGSGSDAATLLATLGGIMGAIFTVGGLIIALVSVYTQLAIEDRIRRSFEALQPELDERARSQIEAHIAFSRATEQQDWREAQRLAQEALEKWPTLQGIRSFLAEQLSAEVAAWFLWRQIDHWRWESDQLYGVGRPLWGYGATPSLFGAVPAIAYANEKDVPMLEAIEWLKQAIAQEEDDDGHLEATLALMYGAYGRCDDMITHIQSVLTTHADLKESLASPANLGMLVYPCRDRLTMPSRLRNLAALLDIALPATSDEVLASLNAYQGSILQTPWTVKWIALQKQQPTGVSSNTQVLATLTIVLGGKTGERRGWATWNDDPPHQRTIPDAGSYTPIADLVTMLDADFVFISQRR